MFKWIKNIINELIVLGIIIILIFAVYYFVTPIGKIENSSLILSFIGVLATFVVVGNFAQTSHIANEMNTRIDNNQKTLETKINDEKKDIETKINTAQTATDRQIEELKNRVQKLEDCCTERKNEIDSLLHSIQQTDNMTNNLDMALFLRLFIGNGTDVQKAMRLYYKLLNGESIYYLQLKNGHEVQCTMKMEDKPIFYSYPKKQITYNGKQIDKISGVTYDEKNIIFAYRILHPLIGMEETSYDEDNTITHANSFSKNNDGETKK